MAKRNKTGGRTKGTPNKLTTETRAIIHSLLSEELPNLRKYISEVKKPELKAKLIIDLLPYDLPKFSNVEVEVKAEKPLFKGIDEIEIIYRPM